MDHNTTNVELRVSFQKISHSDSVNYRIPDDVFSFHRLHKGTLGWLLDLILLTRYESQSNGDFKERKQYYQHGEVNSTQFSGGEYSSYKCRMLPFEFDGLIMRRCSKVTSTCASDWADSGVEAMCLTYTDYYCHGRGDFRNPHCALCNHVTLTETQICREEKIDFSLLLDWDRLRNKKSDPDKQNTTIIQEANDGKLMFSYECACILHAKEKLLRD
jgi:hypothetical protein